MHQRSQAAHETPAILFLRSPAYPVDAQFVRGFVTAAALMVVSDDGPQAIVRRLREMQVADAITEIVATASILKMAEHAAEENRTKEGDRLLRRIGKADAYAGRPRALDKQYDDYVQRRIRHYLAKWGEPELAAASIVAPETTRLLERAGTAELWAGVRQ